MEHFRDTQLESLGVVGCKHLLVHTTALGFLQNPAFTVLPPIQRYNPRRVSLQRTKAPSTCTWISSLESLASLVRKLHVIACFLALEVFQQKYQTSKLLSPLLGFDILLSRFPKTSSSMTTLASRAASADSGRAAMSSRCKNSEDPNTLHGLFSGSRVFPTFSTFEPRKSLADKRTKVRSHHAC